jgi:hypothetical protein
MLRHIAWNGTDDEALALLHALRAHCKCRVEGGRTLTPCPGHAMLAREQRAVDGLLFMRRIAAHLLAGEFGAPAEPVAQALAVAAPDLTAGPPGPASAPVV